MTLLQMSLSGAALILVILLIRAAAVERLPKKTFLLLWWAAIARLLIPFQIPSPFSAYSVVKWGMTEQNILDGIPANSSGLQAVSEAAAQAGILARQNAQEGRGFSAWIFLWAAGAILCALFFIVKYLRYDREFRMSLPVCEPFARQWLKEHPLRRPVEIRESERIGSPLTYGIFRPVILMPKDTDWRREAQLQYVLLHEYVHICHLDALAKPMAVLVLCVHWFNPVVWVMYRLFNRDIELACDETVVRRSGIGARAAYAGVLIGMMEEKRDRLTSLCNHFSRNAVEERITAIMKTKKATMGAMALSAAVILTTLTVFATSAGEGRPEPASDAAMQAAEELVEQQYRDMQDSSYSDWRVASLEQVYTYENFDGMTLQIYRLNYEFLAEEPEKAVLAGGMDMDEDGWVVPGYAGSSYMIFRQEGEELGFLTAIVENDCFPGDEIFTEDMRQAIELIQYVGQRTA